MQATRTSIMNAIPTETQFRDYPQGKIWQLSVGVCVCVCISLPPPTTRYIPLLLKAEASQRRQPNNMTGHSSIVLVIGSEREMRGVNCVLQKKVRLKCVRANLPSLLTNEEK